jgi:hypothetical protein
MIRLFRIIAFGNVLLAALTWSTWFEGNEKHAGFADHLFASLRFSGFRADFVWIVLSIPLFLVGSIFFFVLGKQIRATRIDACLSLIAALANCAAIYHMLFSGLLYFG